MSMEPRAMRRISSLCLEALVPPWNYEVSTGPHFQPIETNQGKNFRNSSTPSLPLDSCLPLPRPASLAYPLKISQTKWKDKTETQVQVKI